MNRVKDFLILHGEKAALAIIAAITLWSIFGNLLDDRAALPLSNGERREVDREQVDGQAQQLEQHLHKPEKFLENAGVQRVSQMVDEAWGQWQRPVAKTDLSWFAYAQPPMPLVLKKLIVIPPPTAVEDVPADYISRAAAPVGLTVIAGGKRTVLVCSDSGLMNYLDPADVQVLLFRKEIGDAREDLKTAERVANQTWPRGGFKQVSVDIPAAEDVPVAEPAMPVDPFGMPGGMPGMTEPKAAATTRKQAAPTESLAIDFSGVFGQQPDAQPTTTVDDGTAYLSKIREMESAAIEDTKALCDPTLLVKGTWQILTPEGMSAVTDELSSDDLVQMLDNGLLPGQKKEETPEANPAEKKTETSVWDSIMGGSNIQIKDKPAEAATDADDSALKTYQRRQYVFIDNTVSENKVYRYRVVLRFKAQLPPKEVLEKSPGWVLRAEVGGMGPSYLALPERDFSEMMKREANEQHFGPLGLLMQPKMTLLDLDPVLKFVKGLRNADGTFTPLGLDMRKHVYTDFAYSAVVVTPVTRQIQVQAANMTPDPLCSLKVIITDNKGEVKERTYQLKPPANRPQIQWHFWLRYGEDKKPVFPQPALNRDDMLYEVYEHRLAGVEPVSVGELDTKMRPEQDYRTGWSVVDMRPYQVIRKSYKKNNNTGAWDALTPLTQERVAVILRQTATEEGRRAQYKRIFPKERDPYAGRESEFKTEFEYIWEPELKAKLDERAAKDAAQKPTTAKPEAAATTTK